MGNAKQPRTTTASPRRVHDYPNEHNRMSTRHLNNLVSDRTDIGISKVEAVVASLWNGILYQLACGEIVIARDFGTFALIRTRQGKVQIAFRTDDALRRRMMVGSEH